MRVSGNYYSGGFAEIVSRPTKLTYSYLAKWFTGNASLGKAMRLLSLPYEKIDDPVLELIDGELLVNLDTEERTLYKSTIFKYANQLNVNSIPRLVVSLPKLIRPTCVLGVIGIVIIQSSWIGNSDFTLKKANKFVENIPLNVPESGNIADFMGVKVWPGVIAVGMMCEFYNQYMLRESGIWSADVSRYVAFNMALNDWFFKSITDMWRVKTGEIDFDEFIRAYGIRADNDYELTSPRWYEMQKEIKKRIVNFSVPGQNDQNLKKLDKRLKNIADTFVNLQLLRSEAKRRALIHFDVLRKQVVDDKVKVKKSKVIRKKSSTVDSGRGMGASGGAVKGVIKNVVSGSDKIPENTIGIFPNASPEFTLSYPKCAGIIFLKGGMTSHGVIVAREFGIPALIDASAEGLPDGKNIQIDGKSGEWSLV